MTSLYQHKPGALFHISAGAVLVGEDGKILAHKRTMESTPEKHRESLGGLDPVYYLMRETVEDGESLEEAVVRGLMEEFGIKGKVIKYLGSIQTMIRPSWTDAWEKTTLYFQASVVTQGERPKDDAEAHSELVWMEPKKLSRIMRGQGQKTARGDLDESKIVDAYLANK